LLVLESVGEELAPTNEEKWTREDGEAEKASGSTVPNFIKE
jgi:hypothetical protein